MRGSRINASSNTSGTSSIIKILFVCTALGLLLINFWPTYPEKESITYKDIDDDYHYKKQVPTKKVPIPQNLRPNTKIATNEISPKNDIKVQLEKHKQVKQKPTEKLEDAPEDKVKVSEESPKSKIKPDDQDITNEKMQPNDKIELKNVQEEWKDKMNEDLNKLIEFIEHEEDIEPFLGMNVSFQFTSNESNPDIAKEEPRDAENLARLRGQSQSTAEPIKSNTTKLCPRFQQGIRVQVPSNKLKSKYWIMNLTANANARRFIFSQPFHSNVICSDCDVAFSLGKSQCADYGTNTWLINGAYNETHKTFTQKYQRYIRPYLTPVYSALNWTSYYVYVMRSSPCSFKFLTLRISKNETDWFGVHVDTYKIFQPYLNNITSLLNTMCVDFARLDIQMKSKFFTINNIDKDPSYGGISQPFKKEMQEYFDKSIYNYFCYPARKNCISHCESKLKPRCVDSEEKKFSNYPKDGVNIQTVQDRIMSKTSKIAPVHHTTTSLSKFGEQSVSNIESNLTKVQNRPRSMCYTYKRGLHVQLPSNHLSSTYWIIRLFRRASNNSVLYNHPRPPSIICSNCHIAIGLGHKACYNYGNTTWLLNSAFSATKTKIRKFYQKYVRPDLQTLPVADGVGWELNWLDYDVFAFRSSPCSFKFVAIQIAMVKRTWVPTLSDTNKLFQPHMQNFTNMLNKLCVDFARIDVRYNPKQRIAVVLGIDIEPISGPISIQFKDELQSTFQKALYNYYCNSINKMCTSHCIDLQKPKCPGTKEDGMSIHSLSNNMTTLKKL